MDAAAIPVSIHPARDEGAEVASVCCYCGTGCGVRVRVSQGAVLAVRGDDSHPANHGRLCSKGLALADTVRADHARVLAASWRAGKDEPRKPIGLDQALDIAADRLADAIVRHGPDSVVLPVRPAADRGLCGLQQAGAGAGRHQQHRHQFAALHVQRGVYKRTLGADAPPACYEDLELADTVLIAGSNMAYAHPVLFRRLEAARARRPGMKLIVVDPRRTDTASGADLHLPLTPGSDVALFHAMLNVMVWEGLVDQDYISAHTSGFEALKARIHEFTPGAAAEVCGIPARDIIQAARWFGGADAALSLYTMGLNQSASGTDKNTALIHLHLATGQIGRPGAGPFSLTGQPNAMGGREAGGMATCCRGTAIRPMPAIAPRRPRYGAWTPCPKRPAPARWSCSSARAKAASRCCGSPPPIRPSPCPTRPRAPLWRARIS